MATTDSRVNCTDNVHCWKKQNGGGGSCGI